MNAPTLSPLDEFNAALSRYIIWSSKGQGGAVEHRAKRIRLELYGIFRRLAKTPQALREEISALGYEFRRRKSLTTGKAVSPEREVGLRIRSLRYLAVSWIFKAWRERQTGQRGTFGAIDRGQKRIGEAIVNTAEGTSSPTVELVSFLEGVRAQNEKRKLIDEALRAQAADMGVYIARKHQEWLQAQFGARTFRVSGEVRL